MAFTDSKVPNLLGKTCCKPLLWPAGYEDAADQADLLDLISKAMEACQPDKISSNQLPAELHVAQEWAKKALKAIHSATALAHAEGRCQQHGWAVMQHLSSGLQNLHLGPNSII